MASFAFFGSPILGGSEKKVHNEHLMGPINELLEAAKGKLEKEDTFRLRNYPKVLCFLRNSQIITTMKELEAAMCAYKGDHGIGKATKDKLAEILRFGTTAKVQGHANSAFVNACKDLERVWGIGPATAKLLASPPYSVASVEDLKKCPTQTLSGCLTDDSRYCLSILEELETRIPRAEVREIVDLVRAIVDREWGPGKVELHCCGSYRRGVKKDCGDVDILLSHVDGSSVIQASTVVGLLGKYVTRVLKSPVDNDSRDEKKAKLRDIAGAGGDRGGVACNDDSQSLDEFYGEDEGGEEERLTSPPSERGVGPTTSNTTGSAFGGSAGSGGAQLNESVSWASKKAEEVCRVVNESQRRVGGVPYSLEYCKSSGSSSSSAALVEYLPHPSSYYSARKSSAMLVIRLGEEYLHRRLDVKVYPRDVLPFALLYFTGSDHYNRSLRNFVNKCGWTLSDHGLCSVSRVVATASERDNTSGKRKSTTGGGEVIAQTKSVRCVNEADVLRAIGAPWRAPCEREV